MGAVIVSTNQSRDTQQGHVPPTRSLSGSTYGLASVIHRIPDPRLSSAVTSYDVAPHAHGKLGPWFEGNPDLVTIDTLKYIHAHKTGALLEVAVTSGAILAGAAEEDIVRLGKYAQLIGLAFQVGTTPPHFEPPFLTILRWMMGSTGTILTRALCRMAAPTDMDIG